MGWAPSRVTVPLTEEPISLAEAREHCRLGTSTDEDSALLSLIVAARMHIESMCGIRLTTQTIEMRAFAFCDLDYLPTAPIQSITGIAYLDPAGVEQELSEDVYELAALGLDPVIRLKVGQSWPATRPVPDAVRVTAVAGYGDSEDVPEDIRHALKLMIGHWYTNRESVVVGQPAQHLPGGVADLLWNYRRS